MFKYHAMARGVTYLLSNERTDHGTPLAERPGKTAGMIKIHLSGLEPASLERKLSVFR